MHHENFRPQGCHTAIPYLTVHDCAAALAFYREAFGARELYRLTAPDGRIGHAEIEIGDSRLMLSDEYPDFGALSPPTVGGSPVKMMLYLPDADAAVERAVKAGATPMRPVIDEFYGDRVGMVADPFGFSWFLATHIRDVPPAEMQAAWNATFEKAEAPA